VQFTCAIHVNKSSVPCELFGWRSPSEECAIHMCDPLCTSPLAIHVKKSFCMWRSPLCPVTRHPLCASPYRLATISRLLQIIGLFCKRALYNNRLYPAKETYHFKEPTDRGHPIKGPVCPVNKSCVCIVSLRQRSPANTGLFCKRPLARQEVGLQTFFELVSLKPHKVCLHSFFAAEDACKHRTLSSYCPPLPFVFVYFAKET